MAAPRVWRYLTRQEIIDLNRQTDGGGRVLNEGNLDAAVRRPSEGFYGRDTFPTAAEKVYAIVEAISQGHPFQNGNKRTATNAVRLFLGHNNLMFQEIPGQPTLIELTNSLADARPMSKRDFVAAITPRIVPLVMKLIDDKE